MACHAGHVPPVAHPAAPRLRLRTRSCQQPGALGAGRPGLLVVLPSRRGLVCGRPYPRRAPGPVGTPGSRACSSGRVSSGPSVVRIRRTSLHHNASAADGCGGSESGGPRPGGRTKGEWRACPTAAPCPPRRARATARPRPPSIASCVAGPPTRRSPTGLAGSRSSRPRSTAVVRACVAATAPKEAGNAQRVLGETGKPGGTLTRLGVCWQSRRERPSRKGRS